MGNFLYQFVKSAIAGVACLLGTDMPAKRSTTSLIPPYQIMLVSR